MMRIRSVGPEDLDSLYAISLATGDRGEDASALYRDGRMVGHVYSAPYASLRPHTCLIAEDRQDVVGFAVGRHDGLRGPA